MSTGRRFLLVTWEGGGVVPPELGLARRLIAAGHAVRVLADPTIEAEATATGCAFTPWTTAPHATSRDRDGVVIKDWEFRNPLKAMDVYCDGFLGAPAPRWAADVDQVLDADDVDAVLVDFALPAAMIPVEARGVPLIGLMPNFWVLPTKGIPPMGPGFTPSRNPLAKARDAALRSMTVKLFNKALPPINETREAYGLPRVESTVAQMIRGERLLVLSSPIADFTSPHLPDNVVYTGPILDDPAWAAQWSSPWVAGDERPLVLVAMSSGYQDQVDALNRAADALATLPVRALITTGLGVEPSSVPSRSGVGDVVVVPHAPHAAILPQASAVVTHCGHGTTMKSLATGVPLVCLPMGRDQNDVAARVVHHGAGERRKPDASAAAIADAVQLVLTEPRYREAAAALGRRIVAGEGCTDPVGAVEAVALRASEGRAPR